MTKPHLEFHTLNMEEGWETPAGYPEGIKQKILAGHLDEAAGNGNRPIATVNAAARSTTSAEVVAEAMISTSCI